MLIRLFEARDEHALIQLWDDCGLTRPWNLPVRDVARKMAIQPELFFVGELRETSGDGQPAARIVASAMAGYDGHRGWINYLAVHPSQERKGLGRQMMSYAEQQLIARGCPKINVQIRHGNESVLAFYRSIGFVDDAVVSMGKRLIPDNSEPDSRS